MSSNDIDDELDDFMTELQEEVDAVGDTVDSALRYACMKVITDARQNGPYTDRTGNLRHSLGYAIIDDGMITDKQIANIEGSDAQKAVEQEAGHMTGIKGAVVVAGMPYASFVEAKGYDVLTGSALNLEKYFKEAIDDEQ